MLKKILLLTTLTSFFSILMFLWTLVLKKDSYNIGEENLLLENKTTEKKEIKIINNENIELSSAKELQFLYFPEEFKNITKKETNILTDIINSQHFKEKISDIKIEFHKEKPNVRWNMKNKTLKLFWVLEIWEWELISVSIHELAHYIDLYYFDIKNKYDLSNKFYNYSWKNYKTIKKWETINSFVSWYAMSNKYEDFAESLVYYVMHNNDFLIKSKNDPSLEKKYNFLKKELFKDTSFVGEDYSEEKIKPYYWDITKINVSLENFLQYIKK